MFSSLSNPKKAGKCLLRLQLNASSINQVFIKRFQEPKPTRIHHLSQAENCANLNGFLLKITKLNRINLAETAFHKAEKR